MEHYSLPACGVKGLAAREYEFTAIDFQGMLWYDHGFSIWAPGLHRARCACAPRSLDVLPLPADRAEHRVCGCPMTDGRQVALVHSAELDRNSYPPQCPFSSKRAGMMRRMLASMQLLTGRDRRELAPRPASRDVLQKLHTPQYLRVLQDAANGHLDLIGLEMGLGTEETPIFRGVYKYATLACGASVDAAALILSGDVRVAFNPSGGYHHAGPRRAAGFCYINDVAIACMVLADQGKRVLFLDVDAHHGDGVQNAFWTRSDVMALSFHEDGRTLFPGTGFEDEIGEGEGRGYSVNVPLPAGTYDDAYLRAFRRVALPLITAFDPDVIVLELGMDCLAGDPLAHLELTNNAYADVVRLAMGFGRPILAVGGGGYHPENTARSWALMWCVFCGEDGPSDMSLGLGGVMLGSADWLGGLRDPESVPDAVRREHVDAVIDATVEKVKAHVFPLHGL